MAKYRAVQTSFWEDPKVIEEMTPEDKLFYLYLLTNPKTTQIGIYQITRKQMAFELGYSIESINALMDRFENHHKLIKYNQETREICILNWSKYNLDNHSKPVLDCIKSELPKVKDKNFLLYMVKDIAKDEIRNLFLDEYELSTGNTSRITTGGEKQKQKEKQKEKEKQQQEKRNVVVDEIKKAFNSFDDKTIKSIEDSFKKKGKDINYLLEKIDITKKANTNNAAGYLISAITNDYKSSINNAKCFIPQVKTRFHNINQTFTNYSSDELEKLLQESQKGKFQ